MKARRFLNLMMASLVAMAYTSCSSSDDVIETPDPVVKTYTMTVDAQKGSNGTRALNLDGNTLNSTWTAGETVKVYEGNTELGTLTAQGNGANTSLKGTLTGDLSVNDELTLKYLSPDYDSQNGTIASISANCDYSVATVKVTNIADGNISTENANFENQQAVIKFTLKNADGSLLLTPTFFRMTDGTSTVTLTIPLATYADPNNGSGVIYVAFPASDASATITLSATAGDAVYGFGKTGITFEKGKYYGVIPVLNGKFTINASGDKVYFSKGNLQYTKSTSTWSFMDHQYSTVETANQNVGTDYANQDVVSLFGWGTGDNPNQTSTDNSDYSSFTDWGNNTNLQSQLGTGWRTLTMDEWTYVFGTNSGDQRSGATVGAISNARYTEATINTDGTGVNGVILFPDGATFADTEATWGTINGSSDWGTQCTTAQWSALEAKGCVFLPAASYRKGSSVYDVGYDGYYWSSTAYGVGNALEVDFISGNVNVGGSSRRGNGMSVRLVREE